MKSSAVPTRAYLDYAASAPVHPAAREAFLQAMELTGNPSSVHAEGLAAKQALEKARAGIAALAGARSHRVTVTSGATEANALAMQGRVAALEKAGNARSIIHMLYLPSAHASIRETIKALTSSGVVGEPMAMNGYGIDIPAFKKQLKPETVLVSLDAICGETGTRFNTRGVAQAITEMLATWKAQGIIGNVRLHIDASQLPLEESFELTRLGADMLVLDAQKVGGVRGVGILITAYDGMVAPIIHGGGQERGLRSGTEPVALVVAFEAALRIAHTEREAFTIAAQHARTQLIQAIQDAHPWVRVIAGSKHAHHILCLALPGVDTEYLQQLLSARGFAVSTRSACALDTEQGSVAVLQYTGDLSLAKSTLRISWGAATPAEHVRSFTAALTESLAAMQHHT